MKHWLFLFLIWNSLVFAGPGCEVTLFPKMQRKSWAKGHQGHKIEEQLVQFIRPGCQKYQILYSVDVDESHPGECFSEEGFLGMPSPNVCNWYHHGFLFLELNGKNVAHVPITDLSVLESGKRGLVQYVWDGPEALAIFHFLALPEQNGLHCQVTWEPKVELTSIRLFMRCYPGFFTSKQMGMRILQTPSGNFSQNDRQPIRIAPEVDNCLFFADSVFDCAKRKDAFGPCVLLFDSELIREANVQVTSYCVETRLFPELHARKARFFFADCKGLSNAEANEWMKINAPSIQSQFHSLSFQDSFLENFNPSQEKEFLDKHFALAGKDADYLQNIRDDFQWLANAKQKPSWMLARQVAKFSQSYQEKRWKLQIEALLNQAQ